MVSVICHNALNKAVQEFNLITPAAILNKAEELILASFSDKDENVNDGMDIALCSLRFLVQSSEPPESTINSKPETLNPKPETVAMLEYAGANNPLWIIRNNTKEIEVTDANKQGVGGTRKKSSFKNHIIQLYDGDSLYIFSDGYADQFGGAQGKKIMRKQFKEILIDGSEMNAEKQKEKLAQTFKSWKGNLEQIDDVCIIGVRI